MANRQCILKNVEPILPEPIKSFRLIIRNLPFNITRPTQLTDYFNPYGQVLEINIPTVRNESNRHGDNDAFRGRGFALCSTPNGLKLRRQMEALNGSIVKTRAIAVDWLLAKSVYDKLETTAGGYGDCWSNWETAADIADVDTEITEDVDIEAESMNLN